MIGPWVAKKSGCLHFAWNYIGSFFATFQESNI